MPRGPQVSGILWLAAAGLAALVALLGVATAAVVLIPAGGKPLKPEAYRSTLDNEAAKSAALAWRSMPSEEKEARRRAIRLFFPQASRADVDAEIMVDLRAEQKRGIASRQFMDGVHRLGQGEGLTGNRQSGP